MISRPLTFVQELIIKTSTMKTQNNNTENANRAKAFVVAGLILIQASLLASEGSDAKQDLNSTKDTTAAGTKLTNALNAGNTYCYLYDVAVESEMEIEDWMCNIQNDSYNSRMIEEKIEMEEWMYNPHNSFWLDLDDAEESELAIESWMTNPNDWINSSDEILLTSK